MLRRMDVCSKWVPLRWPDDWRDPALLDLLEGTPVNCLLLKWGPLISDAALLDRARQRGFALVAEIDEKADRAAALAAAQAAGVSAVALPEPAAGAPLPVIAWAEKSKLPWRSAAAAFAFTDAVWPAIPTKPGAPGAEAGPTGAPWVDSNGWFIQLARTLAPGKPVWASVAPPQAGFLHAAQYLLAVCDAWAYGARWPIAFEPKLAAALRDRKPAALTLWKSIAAAISFFQRHAPWESYAPAGNLAVLSDFSGPNEFTSFELLNLLPRRRVPYRILEKARAGQASFDGLKAILYADEQPPEAALLHKLLAFASAGGVLIAAGNWPAPAAVAPSTDSYRRWNLYPSGEGRLAIVKEPGGDPFLIAADAQVLMSHRHDLIRTFNSSTLNAYYTAGPDSGQAVIHLLNYALRTWEDPVSLALTRRYRAARLWRIERTASEPLELVPGEAGIEVHLPPFGVYAAIELEA